MLTTVVTFGETPTRVEYNLCILFRNELSVFAKRLIIAHSRPLFYQLKTLNIHDMVNFKNMVFMYKVHNKLLPANIMSYFKTINTCHNHNVRMKNCNFKIKFSRTTKNLNVLV